MVDGGTESKVCDGDHKADRETKLNLPENTYNGSDGTPACHRRPQNGSNPHRVGMPQAQVRPVSYGHAWPHLHWRGTNVAPLSWPGGRWVQRGWAAAGALSTGREPVGSRFTNGGPCTWGGGGEQHASVLRQCSPVTPLPTFPGGPYSGLSLWSLNLLLPKPASLG